MAKTTVSRTGGRRKAASAIPTALTIAVRTALEKKAEDVAVLDLRKAAGFTDFFVICTGSNPRQIGAIVDAVERAVREECGEKPTLVEGEASRWVLLDYFDFLVHVFNPESRTFYDLERLWGSAERIAISAVCPGGDASAPA